MASPTLPAAHGLRLALTLALLLSAVPFAASAAAFKCMVGGRTIYQQSPCNTAIDEGSTAAATGAPSAHELAKRRIRVVDEGTSLAQDAFRLLVDGQVDGYLGKLCPRERKGSGSAGARSTLRSTGAELAQRKVTLGRVVDSGPTDLSFVGLEDVAGHQDARKSIRTLKVTARFDWDLDRLCLRTLSMVEQP